ncbi:hypothetical protein LIA77_01422 [Sarocladium implicatum]|nr:hypothetical protein LIA77_01422 [Sarocladium implicatum]
MVEENCGEGIRTICRGGQGSQWFLCVAAWVEADVSSLAAADGHPARLVALEMVGGCGDRVYTVLQGAGHRMSHSVSETRTRSTPVVSDPCKSSSRTRHTALVAAAVRSEQIRRSRRSSRVTLTYTDHVPISSIIMQSASTIAFRSSHNCESTRQ